MNKLVIGIVALIILGTGGYFIYTNLAGSRNNYLSGSVQPLKSPESSREIAAMAQIEIKDFKFNHSKLIKN